LDLLWICSAQDPLCICSKLHLHMLWICFVLDLLSELL
jgi:hypothetical protein